jgi:hypothetical protein
MKTTSEYAFETVIEKELLEGGYKPVPAGSFDREDAVFPIEVLAFIRETQPEEWRKLEALLGDKTSDQILSDLCKWMDSEVLRPHAARRILQGGARTESGTRGAVCRQSPGDHAATPLLAAFGEVAGHRPEPQRYPRGDGGTQEPAFGPDSGGCLPAVQE